MDELKELFADMQAKRAAFQAFPIMPVSVEEDLAKLKAWNLLLDAITAYETARDEMVAA